MWTVFRVYPASVGRKPVARGGHTHDRNRTGVSFHRVLSVRGSGPLTARSVDPRPPAARPSAHSGGIGVWSVVRRGDDERRQSVHSSTGPPRKPRDEPIDRPGVDHALWAHSRPLQQPDGIGDVPHLGGSMGI